MKAVAVALLPTSEGCFARFAFARNPGVALIILYGVELHAC